MSPCAKKGNINNQIKLQPYYSFIRKKFKIIYCNLPEIIPGKKYYLADTEKAAQIEQPFKTFVMYIIAQVLRT